MVTEKDKAKHFANLATDFKEKGDLFNAASFFKKATDLDPDYAWAWAKLAEIQYQNLLNADMDASAHDYQQVIETFCTAIRKYDAKDYRHLGWTYSHLGETFRRIMGFYGNQSIKEVLKKNNWSEINVLFDGQDLYQQLGIDRSCCENQEGTPYAHELIFPPVFEKDFNKHLKSNEDIDVFDVCLKLLTAGILCSCAALKNLPDDDQPIKSVIIKNLSWTYAHRGAAIGNGRIGDNNLAYYDVSLTDLALGSQLRENIYGWAYLNRIMAYISKISHADEKQDNYEHAFYSVFLSAIQDPELFSNLVDVLPGWYAKKDIPDRMLSLLGMWQLAVASKHPLVPKKYKASYDRYFRANMYVFQEFAPYLFPSDLKLQGSLKENSSERVKQVLDEYEAVDSSDALFNEHVQNMIDSDLKQVHPGLAPKESHLFRAICAYEKIAFLALNGSPKKEGLSEENKKILNSIALTGLEKLMDYLNAHQISALEILKNWLIRDFSWYHLRKEETLKKIINEYVLESFDNFLEPLPKK